MNFLNPIFTEKRQCQDCYKCVRNCPVKAIKVEGGCATVVAEECILCGNCVAVCPNEAKKVRDDVQRARQLLAIKPRVIVSLAPSYVAAFGGASGGQMVAALKRLGFAGASETALGAQQVSAHVAGMLGEKRGQILISSACPTVVAYLQKHRPADAAYITPLLSPVLAHCKMLRALYGEEIGIVFISPCIAKKVEADAHPELLDLALTFEDLRRWLAQERINPVALLSAEEDRFIPEGATDGALYPVDGGMIAGVRANCAITDAAFMTFSGISGITKALNGLEHLSLEQSLLLELLACEGGCVNGPAMGESPSTAARRYQVLKHSRYDAADVPRRPDMNIDADFGTRPVVQASFADAQIRESLRTVGKFAPGDELNCGGCGYETCRQFAIAMLSCKAERSMCVTYMRQLAHKKADALIQKMPSAVVIADQGLNIVECNAAFVKLFGPQGNGNGGGAADAAGDAVASAGGASTPASLEGRNLAEVIPAPFQKLFAGVLRSGEDMVDRDIRFRDTVLHLSIFSIEKHVLAGAIIQDITKPAVQKEQVIRKARAVIQQNLATVQKIAYLLGENAAESEITLNSIIESFSLPGMEENDPGGGTKPATAAPDQPTDEEDPHDWRKRYRR